MNLLDDSAWNELWSRIAPAPAGVAVDAAPIVAALLVAGLAVALPPLWRAVRLAVTLVHELGHAVVGVCVGRRFTGFVVRGDMSGHAVTSGRSRGLARVATTWAGYPAPAIVGAALVWLGTSGWAAPATALALVVLILALIRVRSLLTAIVTLIAIGATAGLWWWRDDALQCAVLVGVGAVLIVGAWRHLGSVWARGGAQSDPGVLAQLTPLPAGVWNVSFALTCGIATWMAGSRVADVLVA